MKARLVKLAVIALVLAGADQATKYLVVDSMAAGSRLPLIDGLLDFYLVYNQGAAFGSFASVDQARWLLVGLTVVAIIVAVWLVSGKDGRQLLWPLALISGGALGNLVDRIRLGQVVDFVHVYYGDWYWPTFNLADSAITVGGVMLAWLLLFSKKTRVWGDRKGD